MRGMNMLVCLATKRRPSSYTGSASVLLVPRDTEVGCTQRCPWSAGGPESRWRAESEADECADGSNAKNSALQTVQRVTGMIFGGAGDTWPRITLSVEASQAMAAASRRGPIQRRHIAPASQPSLLLLSDQSSLTSTAPPRCRLHLFVLRPHSAPRHPRSTHSVHCPLSNPALATTAPPPPCNPRPVRNRARPRP